MLTFQYRLLPTKRQHRALEAILESQRQLYNAALEERIGAYRQTGATLTCFDQFRSLTQWRRQDTDASAIPANLQRWTLKQLDAAYLGYFRRLRAGSKPGFPRYRGKGRFHTFGFLEFSGVRLDDTRIRFKGMPAPLRVHFHRPLPGNARIRSCTFRRQIKGWKVGFAIEVPEAPLRHHGPSVGIDLGIASFATLSNGGCIPSLRAARQAERRLRLAQRSVERKRQSSAGRVKARTKVARCHAATARRRANHLHQASARLVHAYSVIAFEKLNLKALARSVLAKDIHDASWGKFISMLRYKAAYAGCRLVEVDSYNTTQECSCCGAKVPKGLGQRRHECPHCGLAIDRDVNAARNILNRAGVGPGLHNVAGC